MEQHTEENGMHGLVCGSGSRRLDISVDRDSDAAGTSPVSAYAGTMGVAACRFQEEDGRWL